MNLALLPSLILVLLSAGLVSTAAGGEPGPDLGPYREVIERLTRAALTERGTWRKLEELCSTAPHRLSGSPGAAAAVEWARQTMLRAGLENVRLEPCTVPHWTRGRICELRIVEPVQGSRGGLPALALGGSVPTPPSGITAEVVEVRSLEELEALGAQAHGRVIFFNRPMDPGAIDPFRAYGDAVDQRVRGAVAAARAGGVAAIVRSMTTRLDDVPHTGGMRYEDGVPQVPAAAVSTRGAERISRLIAAGERVRLHFRQDCRWRGEKPSHNVIGELKGRASPEQIVVVGGHLDGWDVGQGAHDDGSGCCQAIEALRLLKSLGLRPRRTLRAVLFMNEENGLAGGRAYHREHLSEMENHVMALESDRGGFSPRGFTSDANPQALETLRAVAALFEDQGANLVRAGGGGADISPMRRSGVITVGYLPDPQRYFDLHHSERDTLDAISERELELGTAVIAALIYIIADLEEPLPRNSVE